LFQVGRILANLVDNAIKYTPSGGTVVIRTTCDDRAVTVEVEDSGPGLTPEQCASLFAPYQRAKLATYTHGTGLGLYIAKRLTEAQGGVVLVQSRVGVGSKFSISFPCTLAFGRAATAVRDDAPAARTSGEHVPAQAA
jgi:signal transduction histidine kinase